MFTINYKGYWIHGRFEGPSCVQCPDGKILGKFKSFLAGQQAITKHIKK